MMKFNVSIPKVKGVEELAETWTNEDYIELLGLFDFPDAEQAAPEELRELLFMAISDVEPSEAAKIVLTYRLGDKLKPGQIDQISHEMLLDKVAEEYSDIGLHFPMFCVNQLLFKAFNGKFPNTLASVIDLQVVPLKGEALELDETSLLQLISFGLNDHCIIKRLFGDQLAGEVEFKEATSIIWRLTHTGPNTYRIETSKYWLDEEDFNESEFEASLPQVH